MKASEALRNIADSLGTTNVLRGRQIHDTATRVEALEQQVEQQAARIRELEAKQKNSDARIAQQRGELRNQFKVHACIKARNDELRAQLEAARLAGGSGASGAQRTTPGSGGAFEEEMNGSIDRWQS